MVHRGAKYSTERIKCSPQVLDIPRIGSNIPRRCYRFHGEGQMDQRGAKYSTDNVKCSTEVLNIPQRASNVPWSC